MIYSLSLGPAMVITGLFLLLVHGWALLKPAETKSWLTKFPRSRVWGIGLLAVATI